MTPREPDRYEEKAKELCGDAFPVTRAKVAAALRAVEADALERAAQGCAEKGRDYERRAAGQYEHGSADEAGYLAQRASAWRDAESLCRALAFPAASPAAETWKKALEPRDVISGSVRETYAGIDFMRGVAPPSEPAALAPDPLTVALQHAVEIAKTTGLDRIQIRVNHAEQIIAALAARAATVTP